MEQNQTPAPAPAPAPATTPAPTIQNQLYLLIKKSDFEKIPKEQKNADIVAFIKALPLVAINRPEAQVSLDIIRNMVNECIAITDPAKWQEVKEKATLIKAKEKHLLSYTEPVKQKLDEIKSTFLDLEKQANEQKELICGSSKKGGNIGHAKDLEVKYAEIERQKIEAEKKRQLLIQKRIEAREKLLLFLVGRIKESTDINKIPSAVAGRNWHAVIYDLMVSVPQIEREKVLTEEVAKITQKMPKKDVIIPVKGKQYLEVFSNIYLQYIFGLNETFRALFNVESSANLLITEDKINTLKKYEQNAGISPDVVLVAEDYIYICENAIREAEKTLSNPQEIWDNTERQKLFYFENIEAEYQKGLKNKEEAEMLKKQREEAEKAEKQRLQKERAVKARNAQKEAESSAAISASFATTDLAPETNVKKKYIVDLPLYLDLNSPLFLILHWEDRINELYKKAITAGFQTTCSHFKWLEFSILNKITVVEKYINEDPKRIEGTNVPFKEVVKK